MISTKGVPRCSAEMGELLTELAQNLGGFTAALELAEAINAPVEIEPDAVQSFRKFEVALDKMRLAVQHTRRVIIRLQERDRHGQG